MKNDRLFKVMEKNGLDVMLVCRPDNVAYCTGYDTPISYGATDNMADGPFSYAVYSVITQKSVLITIDSHFALAKSTSFADEVVKFDSFDFFLNIDYPNTLKKALSDVLSRHAAGAKTIGVETTALPMIASGVVSSLFPNASIVEAHDTLTESRMIKMPYEIERIARACAIEDAGQYRLLEYARSFSGETEFEVYSGVYKAMCEEAGARINLTGDLATGPRIRNISGVAGPVPRIIESGDAGIFDMSTRVSGYWCDCTNTVCFGRKPNAEQRGLFETVKEAFDSALAALKPGNTLKQADTAAASAFARHGMKPVVYTGHQVGCHVNEPPRILCYDTDTVIAPDMVVCIEPQNYTGDKGSTGVRLERVVHITQNGPVLLNKYPWGFEAWD